MQQSFSNILVPVDFTQNTEVAVAKALDVIDKKGGTLHLLHVQKAIWRNHATTTEQVRSKLATWKGLLEESVPGIMVQSELKWSASVHKGITDAAGFAKADLIIIGKRAPQKWPRITDAVNPSKIAAKSGVPVLTVRPGSMHQPIKTIVVPVSESLPEAKMKTLTLLCSRLRPMVHLVAFGRQAAITKAATNTLLHLYEWVQNTLQCPVEFTLLEGKPQAKQLMRYAAQINADVLLVHPEKETRLDFWNRQIQDILPAHSKVQVLAVRRPIITKQETHYE
jgi:nucleotide-binding universal stress UspA family protein